MRRLRTKLLLAILVVMLVPLVPSYHLVRQLVDRSFDLLFNDTVETAIDGAKSLSQQLYVRHRQETLELAASLENSPHVRALLSEAQGPEAEAGLRAEAEILGAYALDVYNAASQRVLSIRALPDSVLPAPVPSKAGRPGGEDDVDIHLHLSGDGEERGGDVALSLSDDALGARIAEEVFALALPPKDAVPIDSAGDRQALWADGTEPSVLSLGGAPSYVSVHVPVLDGDRVLGHVLVSRLTPGGFPGKARRVMAVNQLFQGIGYYREEARLLFISTFVVFYLVLAALAAGVAYFFARRLTSPLLRLVDGTRMVADGNLDHSIEVESRDEIGQLVESFNQMIAAIKQNQRLAAEREQERLQVAAESAQHEADLEVARVRSRALQAENEAKDLELKRGQELARAYAELEESHRALQEAQAQLILQEKMASLGTMVAGFAHEINNPMGAVHSAADVAHRCVTRLEGVLQDEGTGSPELDAECEKTLGILHTNLRVIGQAEERITRLVESLRNFARLDEAELLVADLHEGLDSSLELIGQELGAGIRVRREYGDIQPTFCAAAQINQVFLNVLRNAAQAIAEKGAGPGPDSEPGEIRIRTGMEDDRIAVRVSDTGTGIPPEQLERIFDLRFSAKSSRVKLGSGLSMAYRIVQEHEGELRLDSEPGEGTEVTILLPVREAGEVPAAEAGEVG